MRKFSRRRKTQPTPPVCKGVPPPPVSHLDPPGSYAIASAIYDGPTSSGTISLTTVITLLPDLTPGLYRGESLTPGGIRVVMLARFPTPPPTAEIQLFGFDGATLLFGASGTGYPIAYNPWLTSQAINLVPNIPGALALVTLAQ